jgi:hypothetical protein
MGGLGLAVLIATPGLAPAQYYTPAMVPPNPLYQHPAYQFQYNIGATVPTAFGRTFIGVTVPYTRAPQFFSPYYGQRTYNYSWSGSAVPNSGYLTGSIGRYDSYSSQREFEKAQRDANRIWGNPDAVKNLIREQIGPDKVGFAPGAGAGKPTADALVNALRAATESEISSGEALNQILLAIVTAEAKGAKGVSPFTPPQVLEEIRFAGAAGEALNLLRQAGHLPFPTGFDAPPLAGQREAIERDFSALAAPLLAGKPFDPARLATFETTLKKAEAAAPAVIRDLSFEEAIATRRFLNLLAGTVRTLRAGGVTGLVNPTWATEGTSVAELVKHMTRFKLQFARAAEGNEPAYLALHRAMTIYLLVLTQPKK